MFLGIRMKSDVEYRYVQPQFDWVDEKVTVT